MQLQALVMLPDSFSEHQRIGNSKSPDLHFSSHRIQGIHHRSSFQLKPPTSGVNFNHSSLFGRNPLSATNLSTGLRLGPYSSCQVRGSKGSCFWHRETTCNQSLKETNPSLVFFKEGELLLSDIGNMLIIPAKKEKKRINPSFYFYKAREVKGF